MEQQKRHLLIASLDAKVGDPLLLPSVILISYFMISKEMRLAEATDLLRQRCYFYTAKGAIDKDERLQSATRRMEISSENQGSLILAHETSETSRVSLPKRWQRGLQSLEDHILARRIKATRRQQVDFRAKFVM